MPRHKPIAVLDRLAATLVSEETCDTPDWRKDAITRAEQLFDDHRLHIAARTLATSHKCAIDYLTQAPALVLAIAGRTSLGHTSGRRRVAQQFHAVIADGPRLKEVLRLYGLAYPLRDLSGRALRREHYRLLPALALVNPSALAQSIPKVTQDQLVWLNTLCVWQHSLCTPSADCDALLAWATANLSNKQTSAAPLIIDFAAQNADAFDTAWNHATALAMAHRWHTRRIVHVIRPCVETPVLLDPNAVADYGKLPLACTIGGFDLVALDTAAKLEAEGLALNHCVAKYVPLVLSGVSWIYSVRRDGRSLATFELHLAARLRSGQRHYVLAQAKAFKNVKPLPEIKRSIDRFVGQINALDAPSTPPIGVL